MRLPHDAQVSPRRTRPRATLLLTGFEPFGPWKRNVTREAVSAFDGEVRDGVLLRALELPVAFPRAIEVLERGVARARPSAVLSFGIHRTRGGVFRVEEVAANDLHFKKPDNDGTILRGKPVVRGGPPKLEATLPTDDLLQALKARGLRARRSNDAGRYLCNAVYYWLLRKGPPAAFIHVPPLLPDESWDEVLAAVDATASVAVRVMSPERLLA